MRLRRLGSRRTGNRGHPCAKRLLLETSYPVSKIADIAGFGSTGYFIQFFQTRVGKTPRRFRNDLAK
ncbi:MAG TPA: helix-turn-helix domain-containing protein [Lacipirellulaceae bacterium]|nr:helix-turn-helix domain-containing protein [Lacipirellulaceae bacterium]